jgi:dipeptidyl aminopeptidase/acylaminoacyl peptidase
LNFNTNQVINLTKTDVGLAEDEGYLFLAFETNKNISDFVIKPIDSGKKINFKDVNQTNNYALLKVKAGEYYWDYFFYYIGGRARFNYDKDEKVFKVEAGVINYPGSWVANMEISGFDKVYQLLTTINKSSLEIKRVQQNFPDLYKKHAFKFQGSVKDNYSEYLKQVILDSTQDSIKNVKLSSKLDDFNYFTKMDGVYNETLAYKYLLYYLKEFDQSVGSISPDGNYLIFQSNDKGVSRISVLNLTSFELIPIFQKILPKNSYISEMEWIDNNSIYYNVLYDGLFNRRVAHLKINKEGQLIGAEHLIIPTQGVLVNALVDVENTMYFANNSIYSKRKNGIYKIDTSSDKSIKKSTKKPFKIIKELEDAVYWLTAADGEIRFIITSEYKSKEELSYLDYWFLAKGQNKWSKIKSFTSNDDFEIPIGISLDQKTLFAITNNFSDKKSIHKYSSSDFEHQGVFYESDEFDIVGIKINAANHDLVGVFYVENGFHKIKYFEDKYDILKPIKNKYPEHKFYVAQQNLNSNKVLVYGTNEYSKGSWSLYYPETEIIDKLFELNPDYNKLEKGKFHSIKIKSTDNMDIEGYLVTPNKHNDKNKKHPLIVIPHGGPIGVRDYAYDSDIQHFYASQGYATLKVNYRGSSGYGKKFQESGKGQWGDKIESDINEMVDHVIKNYNLSENEICAMGSSYGGYSAVMLSILYPDRYKCAVSLAGVMDLNLLFTSSDFRHSEKVIESFKNIVGDPTTEHQSLIDKSPLYLTDKIINPILLFHGAKDKRVTLEHSRRMKEILDLKNKQSELIVFTNEGHSFDDLESEIVYIARSLDFIKASLEK